MNLNFESLFKQAIAEWPQEIDLSNLQQSDPDLNSYTVKGLGRLLEEIEAKYIGTNEEVILRDLHSAIYEALHALARFIYFINISLVRAESVRLIFDRRLKKAATNSNLNWRPQDFALAELYFAENMNEINKEGLMK